MKKHGWHPLKWVAGNPGFFIPVNVLSRVFRGKFLDYLKQAYNTGELRFCGKISPLKRKKVNSKSS